MRSNARPASRTVDTDIAVAFNTAHSARLRRKLRPHERTVCEAHPSSIERFECRATSGSVAFFIRSDRVGTPGLLDALERAVWSVNATLALGSVQTLDDVYRRSIARTSLTLVLLAIMGAMPLSPGLVGIYGVIGHILTERRREMGVRLALGAQHATLKRMLVSQVLLLVIFGRLWVWAEQRPSHGSCSRCSSV